MSTSQITSLRRRPMAFHEKPGLLQDVIEEHLAEAAFYMGKWDRALGSLDHTLDELRWGPEELLRANVDGLVVGGEDALELLWSAIEGDDVEDWTGPAVAALALLKLGGPTAFERLLGRLPESTQVPLWGVARAFIASDAAGLDQALVGSISRVDAAKHPALFEVLADRGLDPGPVVDVALTVPIGMATVPALRAIRGRPKSTYLCGLVERFFGSPDRDVRETAIATGLLWGMPSAAAALADATRDRLPHALLLTALTGGEREQREIFAALDVPAQRAAALGALRGVATVEAADACLRFIADSNRLLGHLAAEAFAFMTGLDLGNSSFAVPVDKAAELSDEDGTIPHWLAALPDLDGAALLRWWEAIRQGFRPRARYLRGHLWTPDVARDLLGALPMRWRHLVLQDVALHRRDPGPISPRSYHERHESCARRLLPAGIRLGKADV
jgi:uncharacterized protein (TIGR02270 family)